MQSRASVFFGTGCDINRRLKLLAVTVTASMTTAPCSFTYQPLRFLSRTPSLHAA